MTGDATAPRAEAHRLTSGRLLSRNVALNAIGGAVPVLLAFVAIPILVRGLGEARFGVLSLAWALVGYFSLFDLGMGRALTQLVAEALGRDTPEELGSLVWTALWVLAPLGFLGTAAVLLGAPALVRDVLRIPDALQQESVRAFQLLALAIPFTVHSAGLRGVLEATQSFGRVNALRLPLALVTFVAPIVILPLSPTLPAAVGALAVGRAVLWWAHVHACRQVFAPMREVRPPESRHLRALIGVGGWMTVSNVVSPLMYAGDRFVVGALLSIAAVADYATAYEAVTRLWAVTGVLLPVLFPGLALALTIDRLRAARLFDRALRATLLAAFAAALVVGAFAPEWLTAWVGADMARRAAPLAQVLAGAVFVNVVAQIVYTLVQSAGRADLTGKFHLLEILPYAALLWALLGRMGTMGVVVAWAVRAALDAALLFVAAGRVVPETRAALRRTGVLTAVATPLLLAPLALPSLPARVVYTLSVGVVAAVYGWLRLVAPDERALAWRMVRPLLPGARRQAGEAA
jgi:O-antigen/teichoic acid export membrane protein